MDASIELKLAAAVLVLIAGLLGGMLGGRFGRVEGRHQLPQLANAFAGGVFLGAALMHMLPDSRDAFGTYLSEIGYPIDTLIASLSFLAILLLDKVMLSEAKPSLVTTEPGNPRIAYVLALVLSIHSVITGIALGLETAMVGAAAILLAILAHKTTAAMALAVSMDRAGVADSRRRRLLGIFYLSTPSGIVAGALGAHFLASQHSGVLEGTFDALAAGTFLYIAIVDILSEEFRHPPLAGLYIAVITGFALMALVAIWT